MMMDMALLYPAEGAAVTTEVVTPSNLLILTDEQMMLQESLQDFHKYAIRLGTLVLLVIGILGSVLSLCVLLRRDMLSTTYTFLTGLAFANIVVIITGTAICTLTRVIDDDFEVLVEYTYMPVIAPIVRPACLTAISTSIWITVMLTLDRYLAVCHHRMKFHTWFNIQRARKVMVAIVACAAIFNIPTFFEKRIMIQYAPQYNVTVGHYIMTEVGASHVYQFIYKSWLFLSFLWLIPFCALTYMNAQLIIQIQRSRKRGRDISAANSPPHKMDVTIMLIIKIMFYLVCMTPHMISIMVKVSDPTRFRSTGWMKFYYISILLILANSSLNIFIYTLFGKKFRRKFRDYFCCCWKSGNRNGSTAVPI